MKTVFATLTLSALVIGPESRAQSAKDILDAAWAAQTERWQGLDSYLVEQTVMGRPSKQYFVRTTVADSAGNSRVMFVTVPGAGRKPGCVNTQQGAGGGDSSAEYMTWFFDNAELVGEEAVDGKAAWQLRANDVDQSQVFEQGEASIRTVTMWLSKDGYLPLKMRMEGTADIQGQARPIVMNMLASDFRKVPDSQLLEPFRRNTSVSGIMGGMDEAQVAEARTAMAEFEKEMASMPAAQRERMMAMMGPRIEQMKKMSQGGAFESEIVINSITPNPEAFGERVVACN
ncbi:MAG: hypothetical protein QNJ00_07095 [Woeseiaceae bacterium]|nr:hypothetical protein [Woeseiaceae bacterium]